MTLSDRIIQCRTNKGLSQNQLAQLVGVSRQAVSKWENGLSVPDSGKIILLAQVFDVSWEYLATGRTSQTPASPEPDLASPIIAPEPIVEYVDRVVVKRIVRKQYIRNPTEFILVGILGLIIGLLIGLII